MGVLTIWESAQFTVSQARNVYLPGYLLVESRSGRDDPTESSPQQDRSLRAALDMAKTVLRKRIRPRRIFVVKDGDAADRLCFHVIPGTAEVLDSRPDSADDRSDPDATELAKSVCARYVEGATIYGAIELLDFVADARELCRELQAGPESAG